MHRGIRTPSCHRGTGQRLATTCLGSAAPTALSGWKIGGDIGRVWSLRLVSKPGVFQDACLAVLDVVHLLGQVTLPLAASLGKFGAGLLPSVHGKHHTASPDPQQHRLQHEQHASVAKVNNADSSLVVHQLINYG